VKEKFSKEVRRVMIIDEVDVFFSKEFFGQLYRPATTVKSADIESLVNYVWNNKDTITLKDAENSAEFKKCLDAYPKIPQLLKYNLIDMISSVRNFQHVYVVHDNKIGYVLPEGLSFSASYGWKTIFAYYYEAGRGSIKMNPSQMAELTVTCCELSYAMLPTYYKYITGVTGTLDILPACQKRILESEYRIISQNMYYIPSVYGNPIRKIVGATVVQQADHFNAIVARLKV